MQVEISLFYIHFSYDNLSIRLDVPLNPLKCKSYLMTCKMQSKTLENPKFEIYFFKNNIPYHFSCLTKQHVLYLDMIWDNIRAEFEKAALKIMIYKIYRFKCFSILKLHCC